MNAARSIAPVLTALCALASCASPRGESRAWPVMGTIAQAEANAGTEGEASRAIDAVRAAFDHVNATMSNWSEASELSRLNREAARGDYRIEDPDLAACLEASLDAARRTGGAFDPTVGPLMTAWGFRPKAPRVPGNDEIARAMSLVGADKVRYEPDRRTIRFEREGMELDLGGIAKGCALDIARASLAPGKVSGLLDLGGNLAWFGDPRTRIGTWIGARAAVSLIKDPRHPERVCAEAQLPAGMAVATSSDVENHTTIDGTLYGHIMDPRTGRPSDSDVVQATAFHRSATVTDVLSTALFVAGSARAPAILQAYPGAEAVLFVREGDRLAVLASRSLEGRLVVLEDPGFAPASPRFTLPAATMAP